MPTLFEYNDYKSFLKDYLHAPERKRGDHAALAKAVGCQAAYLSQVVNGTLEFTEDHAYRLTVYMEFSSLEAEYFLILVRAARAGTLDLKTYLEERRLEILRKKDEISSRISAQRASLSEKELRSYFCSWIPSTLHLATSVPAYQSAEILARRFNLPLEKIKETLHLLKDLGLVHYKNEKWEFVSGSLHIPRASSINSIHQITRRHQAIRSIENSSPDDIHFSSIFTIASSDLAEIREILLKSVESTHRAIHSSGSEEVYGMCLDFFKV